MAENQPAGIPEAKSATVLRLQQTQGYVAYTTFAAQSGGTDAETLAKLERKSVGDRTLSPGLNQVVPVLHLQCFQNLGELY